MFRLRSNPLLWFPALFAMAAVNTVSRMLPGSQMPPIGFWHWDKVAHFIVFAILALLWLPPLRLNAGWSPKKAAVVAALIISAFGWWDEWVQSFTPDRSADPLDGIADTLGACCAVALYYRWRPKAAKPQKQT